MLILVGALLTGCGKAADPAFVSAGQEYVETVLPEITRSWDAEELIGRADPKMLEAFPADRIREMMARCARELGHVKDAKTVLSSSAVMAGVGFTGKQASYVVGIECDKAPAEITITIYKPGEKWKILGFFVNTQVRASPRASRFRGPNQEAPQIFESDGAS